MSIVHLNIDLCRDNCAEILLLEFFSHYSMLKKNAKTFRNNGDRSFVAKKESSIYLSEKQANKKQTTTEKNRYPSIGNYILQHQRNLTLHQRKCKNLNFVQ